MELTTVAPVLTNAGVIASTYYEIVEYLKAEYRAIYGDDVYLENDSQDGQWIGVIARLIAECGAVSADVYASFSPKTAKGEALSRNVAINGIRRALASYSYVDVVISGTPGTEIKNGFAVDKNNHKWIFTDELITIPESGFITVTARSEYLGAIVAQIGTVNVIGKPTRGWVSVINETTSQLGVPIENDAKLRQRQALSVAIPAQSKLDGIKGALFGLDGVSRCKTYENETSTVDALGLPPHSVCIVVSGGDVQEIAQIMRAKKSLGCRYFGNTNVTVMNSFNEPEQVALYRPNLRNIGFSINLESNSAYTTTIGQQIKQALADHINQLDIGDKITINKAMVAVGLYGSLDAMSYEVISMTILVDGIEQTGNYYLDFNEVAYCDMDNIEINIAGGD